MAFSLFMGALWVFWNSQGQFWKFMQNLVHQKPVKTQKWKKWNFGYFWLNF